MAAPPKAKQATLPPPPASGSKLLLVSAAVIVAVLGAATLIASMKAHVPSASAAATSPHRSHPHEDVGPPEPTPAFEAPPPPGTR
jgi:hypothetical protein